MLGRSVMNAIVLNAKTAIHHIPLTVAEVLSLDFSEP